MREERRITDLFTWRQISLCDLGGVSFWEPEMFKVISPNRGDAVSHRTFYRSSPFCPLLLWTGAGIVGIHLGYWFRQEPISTIFSWGFSCLRVIHKPKLSLTVSSNKFCVYVVYGTIPVWYVSYIVSTIADETDKIQHFFKIVVKKKMTIEHVFLWKSLWVNCYCWGNSSILEGRFSKWL